MFKRSFFYRLTLPRFRSNLASAMPAGVSNGSSIQGQRRALAIHLLAEGFSPWYVSNRLRCAYETVKAVRDTSFEEIRDKKPLLASLHERNAILALSELGKRLETGPDALTPTELNIVAGTSTDKMLNLRGEPGFTMRVEHFHRLNDDDLYGFALKRSEKTAQATVIDSPPMLTNGDAPAPQHTLQGCNHDSSVMKPSLHVASHGKGKRTAKGGPQAKRRSVSRKKSNPAD